MNEFNDNAAKRFNFISEIYQLGVDEEKRRILNTLPQEWSSLHQEGAIHIHDLEGYGKIYNCCTPNLRLWLKKHTDRLPKSQNGIIQQVFSSIKTLISSLAVCQTGGIGFSNFDTDLSETFEELDVVPSNSTVLFLEESTQDFIEWINKTHTRYSREPYYLTLNIGLDTSIWGRAISHAILDAFLRAPNSYSRPNIVFKVNNSKNGKDAPNYDLLQLALRCSALRMIPTYLLTDSIVNKSCDPKKISIMGCRTRVYENRNGEIGSLGRGNIACVSINLPQIALKSTCDKHFFSLLDIILISARNILMHRAKEMHRLGPQYLQFVIDNEIWNATSIDGIIKNGTLSIGFIGISECVEILTGSPPFESRNSEELAIRITNYIRNIVNDYKEETGYNFSLLGTPGELISGRFCQIDSVHYPHYVQQKGFYTNSFHANVNAKLSIFQKIDLESPFHVLCNGGCITYVELGAAPLGNIEALHDIIGYASEKGISYLGFNFPYDLCRNCGLLGTFDECPSCGSLDVMRLRRVSGYIEEVTHFTEGKIAEVQARKANSNKVYL